MFKYNCLNPIANVGLDLFVKYYEKTEDTNAADAILVRSASMHEMELSENLLAVARAGAGVNNIPLDKCAEKGIVVFNTPGANANGVKELVIAAMLYASRDLIGGIEWCIDNKDDANIAKTAEKQKKNFAGYGEFGVVLYLKVEPFSLQPQRHGDAQSLLLLTALIVELVFHEFLPEAFHSGLVIRRAEDV